MMHSSVLNNIDTLGKATDRLAARPAELIAQLQVELKKVQHEYTTWQKSSLPSSETQPNLEAAQLEVAKQVDAISLTTAGRGVHQRS